MDHIPLLKGTRKVLEEKLTQKMTQGGHAVCMLIKYSLSGEVYVGPPLLGIQRLLVARTFSGCMVDVAGCRNLLKSVRLVPETSLTNLACHREQEVFEHSPRPALLSVATRNVFDRLCHQIAKS